MLMVRRGSLAGELLYLPIVLVVVTAIAIDFYYGNPGFQSAPRSAMLVLLTSIAICVVIRTVVEFNTIEYAERTGRGVEVWSRGRSSAPRLFDSVLVCPVDVVGWKWLLVRFRGVGVFAVVGQEAVLISVNKDVAEVRKLLQDARMGEIVKEEAERLIVVLR